MDLGRAPETGTVALILFTAMVGVLMGVFGKAAAEWLLNLILRPIRFVREAVYSWIAPRNPLSISLRSYKRHVARSNLTRIENPVGPNLEVPLEHAFAPLRLISGTTEESVDLFSQAAASHRCIVLGGPGTGKTTLMKSLVTSVVKRRVSEEELKDLIPVFVVLRNLARKDHTVEEAIVAAFADYHFPGAEKFVASALEQGKMLVILDGLDEVGASRDFVAGQIQKFCEYDDQRAGRHNRLIVTCREHSYRTKDLQGAIPEVVRVEPFANHHMRVFLQGWPAHRGRTAMKLYGLIQNDPQIRDICRNPLMLTILTGLYLDTDNFELPSSRERFYKDAVDELLIHRPERRHVKQVFDADDKRQILERVALDRLETVTRHEDPEEFTREVIRQKAEEVLRGDKFDPRELLKELVEVNGIIKPGNEGSYTCAHRTIQEYFAAREARRKRETREVVEHFGGRPEFIEVLYFYCGLVDNLPALAYVVNTLVEQGRWVEAGRCILYMKEPPDRTLIERVARELCDLVSPSAEYKAALEVLSSLAQRRASEFDPARDLFARAVDRLAEGYGESGASALESALATSPAAAMKVIPVLLRHPLARWKKAAVQLLRDIGTDEALDQLAQLLNPSVSPDPFVREQAGRTLAEMLKSRPHDLRARAALLPARTDATVWPLEDYFPGRLAIPIAESLGDSDETKSEAINYAARALRASKNGADESERVFLRQWRRVSHDLTLHLWRRRLGTVVVLAGYAFAWAWVLFFLCLQFGGYRTNQAALVTFMPSRIYWMDAQPLERLSKLAKEITSDIEGQFPPNASGLSRLLPWNWWVEPILPEGRDNAYETVKTWANSLPDPYTLPGAFEPKELQGLVSDDKIAQLQADLVTLNRQLPEVGDAWYAIVKPALRAPLSLVPIQILVLLYFIYDDARREKRWRFIYDNASREKLIRDAGTRGATTMKERRATLRDGIKCIGSFDGALERDINISFMIVTSSGVAIIAGTSAGMRLVWLLPLLSLAVGVTVGVFLQKYTWPKNVLLPAVAGLLPRSSDYTESRHEAWKEEGGAATE